MKTFSVVAKNDKIKQTNEVCDFEYAVEMYRYLTVEADFPNVYLMDNETGEVLLSRVVETTITEYVSPTLLAGIPEDEEEITEELEIEVELEDDYPNDMEYEIIEDEELQNLIEENTYNLVRNKCMTIIKTLLESEEIAIGMHIVLKIVLNDITLNKYSLEKLQELEKRLDEITKKP